MLGETWIDHHGRHGVESTRGILVKGGAQGKPARIFTTTMGSAQDLLNGGFRRLLVNACYWAIRMEGRIAERSSVELVGAYEPLPFQFGGAAKGVKPSDLELR